MPFSPARASQVATWIRPEIRGLSPYHVPDAAGLIKLDAMENPYPWPGELQEAWLDALRGVHLNRYPDGAARGLKASLRDTMAPPASMDLMLGNGSDELIQIILLSVAAPGRCVITPGPAFAMYRLISLFAGLEYHEVPLREDFSLDLGALLESVERHQPAVVFIAYPNNPTGNLFDPRALRQVIEASPGLVVLDEAYHPFAQETVMGWLEEFPNLLLLRTLSKLGLAGLRLGILVGPPLWVRELEKVRLPYNVSTLAQLSAAFAMRHAKLLDAQAGHIRQERERLHFAMQGIEGLTAYPSRANFLLFRTASGRASKVFQALRDSGILIKNLSGSHPLLTDCLRVTVGTPAENDAFVAALAGSSAG
jgi:histidinol-phosphate aminotransferase